MWMELNVDNEDLNSLYLTNHRAHNCYDVRTLKFFLPAEC